MSKTVNQETHAETILRAVAALGREKGKPTFARRDIREQIGISYKEWMSGFTAIFQAMRTDHPGGAPHIGDKYRNVFKRIARGNYTLTDYGKSVVSGIDI